MADIILQALIVVIMGGVLYVFERSTKAIDKKIDGYSKEHSAITNGIEAVLRYLIIENIKKVKRQGFADIAERDNISNLYIQYKNLGGNGVISSLVDEMYGLPTEHKEKDDEKNKAL